MATSFVAGGGIKSKSISDFDPRTLSGCVLWLDADDSNTLFTDTAGTRLANNGDSLARWNDKSISGNNATQSTATNRPNVNRNSETGSSNIGFIQASQQTLDLTLTNLPVGADPGSYFIVFRGTSNRGNMFSYGTSGEVINVRNRFRLVSSVVGALGLTFYSNNDSRVSTTPTSSLNIFSGVIENHIISTSLNGGTPVIGDQQPLGGMNTGTSFASIGGQNVSGGGTNFYDGTISEILVFNRALQNDERQQVEGYLAWKWGLVMNLPTTHPYYYAKAPQSYFQPTNFPACALWLDAADTNTITRSVSQWTDKSGNGNHATQSTAANQPLYINNALTFNGTSNTLALTSTSFISNTNFTFFFVERRTSGKSSNYFIGGSGSTANSNLHVGYSGGAGPNQPFVGFYTNDFGATSVGAYTTPITRIFKFNLTTTGRTIVINGTQTGTNATATKLVSFAGASIGSGSGALAANSFYQGVISEVLCYTNPTAAATTAQQDQLIEGYLAHKWGLVSELPGAHSYKSTPPLNFIPTSIPGCQLWLDAADSSSVVAVNVTKVNDKSGNNVDLGTASGFTYSNTFNGTYPSFFNSTPGNGRLGFNAGFITSNPMTFFSVIQSIGATAGTFPYIFNTGTGSTRYYIYGNANSIARISAGGSSADRVTDTDMSTIQVLSATFGASTSTLFTNGTSGTTQSITGGATTGISIAGATNDNIWLGHVSEFVIFNTALTTAQRQQVEGYLGWKWGLQSQLPSTHPFTLANYFFNNTKPLTRYFNPPDIEGCQLWLDAADSSVVTTTGTNVSSIQDKSGLANNLSTSSSTITYTSSLNNLPVLRFPSTGTITGNILTTPSLTRDPVNFSAFYVCRYPSGTPHPIQAVNFDLSTATSTTISGATNNSTSILTVTSSTGFQIGRYVVISGVTPSTYNQTGVISAIPSATQITVELSLNTSPGSYTSGGTITQLTSSQMFGHDGVLPNFNIQSVNYEAGTVSRAISSFGYTSPTLTNNTFVLGCVRQNGVFTLSTNGISHTPVASISSTALGNKTTGAYSIFGGLQGLDIGEVVIYNTALTDGERRTIEGYLSWKWGIQRATASTNPSVSSGLVYPTTHPFYNYPPVDVTPMTPALRLYKKAFDPSDLSPVIWIDPQDTNAVTRATASTNRVTQIINKGSFSGNFTPPPGISGPLFTRSSIGNGTNVEFMDFSNGGHYQVTSATMESATTMALNVFPPHNGSVPVGAFVNLTPTMGIYSDNSSATINSGPFQIRTATISSLRTMTITTIGNHSIGNSQSVLLTINTGTFFGEVDASVLNGTYITSSTGNTGSVIILTLDSDRPNGLMAIPDGHVRNNVGTIGSYITQSGTTGSIVKLTSYSSRSVGDLHDFMGRIEYGSIPITSGEIGFSEITLNSVNSNIFTASSVSGMMTGTPLIPNSTAGELIAGTMYYVTLISGLTFRLASSLQNAIAGTSITITNNATLNLAVKCYGTCVTFRTIMNHNITSGDVNINLNRFTLPFQTGAPISNTNLIVSAVEFRSATVSGTSPNQLLTIDLSTPVGRQNPFYAVIGGVPTYTTRASFTLNLPIGTSFSGSSAIATAITIGGLSTTNSTTDNNATRIQFTLPSTPARPTGSITFNGLPGAIAVTGTSNGPQLNLHVTPISATGNTIVCTIPTDNYNSGGRIVGNIGRLMGSDFHPSETSSIVGASILFPVNGFAIENTSLSSSLNSNITTIVWVSHLTVPSYRNGRFGNQNQPSVISTSSTVGGASGDTDNSYRIGMSSFAGNAPRFVLRHNNSQSANFSSSAFWTDPSSGFRVNTAYLNLSQTTLADCLAYSRGISLGGYSYNSNFYNNGNNFIGFTSGVGPTSITGGVSTATLTPAHIRIGTRTDSPSTYTGSDSLNSRWYEGGIGDILIFNSILSVEGRQLVEGFLAEKYRTTESVGGNSIALNTQQTYVITGSGTTTGSNPNFLITLNGTFSTSFIPGTQITISGVTGATGLNRSWTLATATNASLTFLSPTTLQWASGNGGTITGFIGSTVSGGNTGIGVGNSIHPYRLNPTTINSSNTLDLTSATSTYPQNLVAWFDAANPNLINNENITTQANATPPTDNTAVTRWAPTGGWWTNTPLQLTNTGMARYYLNSLNGLPGIYVDGSTNRLSLATATGGFAQYTTINTNNDFTWTVVFRPDSGASSVTPVISVTNGTSNRLMLCSNGTFVYSNGTTNQIMTPSTTLTNAKTHMITIYRSGSRMGFRIISKDSTIGSNGYLIGTTSQSNLQIPTFTTPTLTLGAIGVTGYTTSFTGTIFEFAMFRSALTDQAVQQVEGYLAQKWGLTASLPTSHAYKRIAHQSVPREISYIISTITSDSMNLEDIAVDSAGNVYIADRGNHIIRKLTVSTGVITTIAGTGSPGSSGGGSAATSAQLREPTGVAVDSDGNVYIADAGNNRICKISASTGVITTIAGSVASPNGLAVDSTGNIYVAETGDNVIRKLVAPAYGRTFITGNGFVGAFSGDGGLATSARLNSPRGVAVDSAGNVYIADTFNHRIRKITGDIMTTIAGTGSPGFSGDGEPATAAQLNNPEDIEVDSDGNIYIADTNNLRIRKISASTGVIATIAGTGSPGFSGDGGAATSARLNVPKSVALDSAGNVYIADTDNSIIRKLTPI